MPDTLVASSTAQLEDMNSRLGRAMKLAGKPVAAAMSALPESAQQRVGADMEAVAFRGLDVDTIAD